MKLGIFILLVGILMTGCEQKPEPWFEPVSSIRFKYTKADEYPYPDVKTINYSFGQKPEDELLDTLFLSVAFSGPVAGQDRFYQIQVADSGVIVPGHTTMKEGEDFWFLSDHFKMNRGEWVDSLAVVISRQHISPGFQKKETKTLVLKLTESEDFGAVVEGMNEIKIVVNNYLAQPVWWGYELNYYHPEKYKVLMWLEPLLKNADKLEISSLELLFLKPTLIDYLENQVVLDEETGKRVLFDRMIDYVPDHVE